MNVESTVFPGLANITTTSNCLPEKLQEKDCAAHCPPLRTAIVLHVFVLLVKRGEDLADLFARKQRIVAKFPNQLHKSKNFLMVTKNCHCRSKTWRGESGSEIQKLISKKVACGHNDPKRTEFDQAWCVGKRRLVNSIQSLS